MRRQNRRKPVDEGLDVKKMLYIIGSILALAIIVFVITFLIYSNRLENDVNLGRLDTNTIGNITAEEASTQYGKTVNEMQNSTYTNETGNTVSNTQVGNETKNTQTNSTATNNSGSKDENTTKIAINTSATQKEETTSNKNETTTNKSTEPEKVPDPEFIKPVSGDILKEFADNKLVYSSTLDVWSTHNGIDIKAEKRSVVKASADGTITSIKNDPRYGLTVIIEHVNGYKTVYANLLSTEFVKQGEKVKQGQSIGTVGNTAAFEISDEPHLHFELLKDNEQQDPELYLN